MPAKTMLTLLYQDPIKLTLVTPAEDEINFLLKVGNALQRGSKTLETACTTRRHSAHLSLVNQTLIQAGDEVLGHNG